MLLSKQNRALRETASVAAAPSVVGRGMSAVLYIPMPHMLLHRLPVKFGTHLLPARCKLRVKAITFLMGLLESSQKLAVQSAVKTAMVSPVYLRQRMDDLGVRAAPRHDKMLQTVLGHTSMDAEPTGHDVDAATNS